MSRFAAKHTSQLDVSTQDDQYQAGFSFSTDHYAHIIKPGLSEGVVGEISHIKEEPAWMLALRQTALEQFSAMPMPTWGADLSGIHFQDIHYYLRPTDHALKTWAEVPDDIKTTFDRLGIPEAEKGYLAGVKMQYDSEVVYGSLKQTWEKDGVIFLSMDEGLKQYPDLVKEYFGKLIPSGDNKFAALNAAVWSGGCLTENARIFTKNHGIKSISKIEKGDVVFAVTENGEIKPAEVSAKINSGQKKVYEFFAAGRRIEATANHQFLCAEKSKDKLNKLGKKWQLIWRPLQDLEVGSIIAISKKIPDLGVKKTLPNLEKYIKNKQHETLKIPKKTNRDLLWFFGVWLGDGCTTFHGQHMCQTNIALPEGDSAREIAISVIEKLFGYKVTTQEKASFTINSKALGVWMSKLGFTGKAKTKRIPEWVFGLPNSEKLALLGGLLDTDGWVENEGKTVRFELANKELVEDTKLLALSCGLFSDGKVLARSRTAAFFKKEMRNIYSGTSYSCRITGNLNKIGSRNEIKSKKLLNSRKETFDKYNTITGENLSSLSTEWIGFARIREKKLIGVREVYDIQVDNYANFVTNGIIAHNSFVYVPKNVHVKMPLQTYFRINAPNAGQFERTLIIVDEGASVHYVEGCTAPSFSSSSLHSAVVEIFVKAGARCQYTTVQNWYKNIYNLVTKRARVEREGEMIWTDFNMGSKVTMKYPGFILAGKGARGETLSMALAGAGQHQDTGSKAIHLAPHTSSTIISKSISKGGGRTSYRGKVHVVPTAIDSKNTVICDALLLDDLSRSDTYPVDQILTSHCQIQHEATVSKIGDEQLFYLMSRGMTEENARKMIVNGFIDDVVKKLPLEYAVEMNRLIDHEMEGSIG